MTVPRHAKIAGILWIVFGTFCFLMILANYVFFPSDRRYRILLALLLGVPTLAEGVETLRGTAEDTRGNGMISYAVGCLYFFAGVFVFFARSYVAPSEQTIMLLGAIFCLLVGLMLLAAGSFALSARLAYLDARWRSGRDVYRHPALEPRDDNAPQPDPDDNRPPDSEP